MSASSVGYEDKWDPRLFGYELVTFVCRLFIPQMKKLRLRERWVGPLAVAPTVQLSPMALCHVGVKPQRQPFPQGWDSPCSGVG